MFFFVSLLNNNFEIDGMKMLLLLIYLCNEQLNFWCLNVANLTAVAVFFLFLFRFLFLRFGFYVLNELIEGYAPLL